MNELKNGVLSKIHESDLGPATEGVNKATVALIGSAVLGAIGLTAVAYKHDKAQEKAQKEKMEKAFRDNAQKRQEQVKEYRQEHPVDQIIHKIKGDIKKMITELRSNQKIKDLIDESLNTMGTTPKEYKLVFVDKGNAIQTIQADDSIQPMLEFINTQIVDAIKDKYREQLFAADIKVGLHADMDGYIYIKY